MKTRPPQSPNQIKQIPGFLDDVLLDALQSGLSVEVAMRIRAWRKIAMALLLAALACIAVISMPAVQRRPSWLLACLSFSIALLLSGGELGKFATNFERRAYRRIQRCESTYAMLGPTSAPDAAQINMMRHSGHVMFVLAVFSATAASSPLLGRILALVFSALACSFLLAGLWMKNWVRSQERLATQTLIVALNRRGAQRGDHIRREK